MPNYLGIDYGTKVMGLAWADDLGIALPVGTIPGLNVRGCWQDLAWEVEQRKIDQFVVGYPIHMDETIGKRAREVDAFTEQLKKRFGLPVTRVDERLTTLAAAETLGKKAKKKIIIKHIKITKKNWKKKKTKRKNLKYCIKNIQQKNILEIK